MRLPLLPRLPRLLSHKAMVSEKRREATSYDTYSRHMQTHADTHSSNAQARACAVVTAHAGVPDAVRETAEGAREASGEREGDGWREAFCDCREACCCASSAPGASSIRTRDAELVRAGPAAPSLPSLPPPPPPFLPPPPSPPCT